MYRDWLLGFGEPPVRNSVDPLNRIQGRLISVRIKTTYWLCRTAGEVTENPTLQEVQSEVFVLS
jgi:hypothetical protein